MKELLDKQVVLDAIYATMEKTDKPDVVLGLAAAMSVVKKMEGEPVKPAEKVGRWIYGEDNLGGTGRDGWYCNQCGHFEFWDYSSDMKIASRNLPNHCPKCRAKMQASPTGVEGSDKE